MKSLAILLGLMLAGCAQAAPRVGKPINLTEPQAAEQCRAQPNLAWCHKP